MARRETNGRGSDLWVGSRCPAPPPRVTITVKALSIGDYNHTKPGQMGSSPQLAAIKFTNSPRPGDALPWLIRSSFTQNILLRDGHFSSQSSASVFLLTSLIFQNVQNRGDLKSGLAAVKKVRHKGVFHTTGKPNFFSCAVPGDAGVTECSPWVTGHEEWAPNGLFKSVLSKIMASD